MKIAIPFAEGQIFQHFGKSTQFKLVTVEEGKITDQRLLDAEGHGHGALAAFLKEQGVDTVICGGMGEGARTGLTQLGIQIYAGAQGDVAAAVQQLLEGKLTDVPGGCGHHHGHEEGHGCGHKHDHGEDGHGCGHHEHQGHEEKDLRAAAKAELKEKQHQEKKADKHAEKHAEKHEEKHKDKHEAKHVDKHEGKHEDKHADKHEDKHADKHAEKHAEKHEEKHEDKHKDKYGAKEKKAAKEN